MHTRTTMQALKRYIALWNNQETYIFNSCLDAIWGMVVMVILPAMSLYYVVSSNDIVWSSYGFPIFSLSAAALYDCYARYSSEQEAGNNVKIKRSKLIIRGLLHILTLLLSLLICGNQALERVRWCPFVFLTFSAIILLREVWWRIQSALLFSTGIGR